MGHGWEYWILLYMHRRGKWVKVLTCWCCDSIGIIKWVGIYQYIYSWSYSHIHGYQTDWHPPVKCYHVPRSFLGWEKQHGYIFDLVMVCRAWHFTVFVSFILWDFIDCSEWKCLLCWHCNMNEILVLWNVITSTRYVVNVITSPVILESLLYLLL